METHLANFLATSPNATYLKKYFFFIFPCCSSFLLCSYEKYRELSENGLTSIPSQLLHSQAHLELLYLHHNEITHISPHTFATLRKLKWLMLQDNQLYDLPLQELNALESLEWLNLSTNHLRFDGERFPEQLANLIEL